MDEKKITSFADIKKIIEEMMIPKLDKLLEDSSAKIKEELVLENQGSLLTPDQLFEAKKIEAQEAVKAMCKEMERVDLAINTFEQNKSQVLTSEEDQQLQRDLNNFSERFLNNQVPINLLNKTFQEALGISNFTLFCFYRVGFKLCEEKRYQEASNIFLFLSLMSPYVKDHWIGFGISEREKERYEVALNAFAMASMLDNSDPAPHLYSADCYVRNKDLAHAEDVLSTAKACIKNSEKSDSWDPIVEHIQSGINRLKATLVV